MGLITGTVTIAATGTPQSIARTMLPALPTLSMFGVTYSPGSATQYYRRLALFCPGSNAGTVSVSNSSGGAGGVISAGGSDLLGEGTDSAGSLDNVFVTGTTGDKVLIQMEG